MKSLLLLVLSFVIGSTAGIARDGEPNDTQIQMDDTQAFSVKMTTTKEELKSLFHILQETPSANDMWLSELKKACSFKSAVTCSCACSLLWFRKLAGLGVFGEAIYLLTDTIEHSSGGMVLGFRCFSFAAMAFIGAAIALVDTKDPAGEEIDMGILINRINMVKIDGRDLMAIERLDENSYKLSIFSKHLNDTLKNLQGSRYINFAMR